MKIAAFGDFHANVFKQFDTHSELTGSTRLDIIINVLKFIRDDCHEKGIKWLLFAGDLFDTRLRVNVVVYNAVYDMLKTFKQYGIEILMIPGNHDQVDNSDVPQHSLHSFNDIDGVTVVSDLSRVTLFVEANDDHDDEWVEVFCIPYSKNAQRIKDWVADIEDTKRSDIPKICLFHLGISGAVVGSKSYPMAEAFNPEDLRPDLFDYLVGGHFHRPQKIAGYKHFAYTGAPLEHSFSDEGEAKGYVVIDTNKGIMGLMPIPSPKFITMTLGDIKSQNMQAHVDSGNYIRVQVKDTELQQALKLLPQGLHYKVELERVYEEQTRVDVKIGMSEEEVVKKYAEEHLPEALEVGLKILEEVKGNV